MTEQEYINVRDLSNVIHATMMIGDICIENQPNIPKDEYMDVIRKVWGWRDKMFEVTKIGNQKG